MSIVCDVMFQKRTAVDRPQNHKLKHRVTDNSLARPGRKQATATEGFDFHISYL